MSVSGMNFVNQSNLSQSKLNIKLSLSREQKRPSAVVPLSVLILKVDKTVAVKTPPEAPPVPVTHRR